MEYCFSPLLILLIIVTLSNCEVCSNLSIPLERSYRYLTTASVGECITLNCIRSDTAQWKLNGTDISNATHYNINTTSGTLTIQELRSTDTGNYTCGSGSISLIVQIPDIVVTGQYTNLTVGSSVSINCTTMPSIPNSVIKWHSSLLNSNSNELIINPVMLSHTNQIFTCVMSSDLLAMSLTESITISVLDTSVSSVTVQSLSSYVIGDDVSIVCTISLTNAIGPDVSSLVMNWFKDNEMITDNIIINGSSSTFNSTLTLTQVSPTDAGVYTCNASINGSNNVLSDSKDLCLQVPFYQSNDKYTDLPLGYSARIQCMNLSSLNEISIKWTDSNGSFISNNNTLILPNVVPSLHNTEYTCTAEVDTNPVTCLPDSKMITIYVKRTYVSSIVMSSQLSILINSTVKINCFIILNTSVGPGVQPNVTWIHDVTDITHYSSLIRDFEFDILFTSILTIDSIQVSDAGVYHCNAGIDSNVTTKSISVCVAVNETLPLVTEELSLGQYYSVDCITGPVPTGVSVSWLLTNGSIYSNNNTLMIPSILPSHNNTQYNCTIMIETNPSDCSTQLQVITFRVKATYINLVTITPSSIVSFTNSSVLLTCTINLNTGIGPDTSFVSHYWYQYSIDISNRSTQLMINGDSKSLVTTLNITSIQLSDAGVYQCGASTDGNTNVRSNQSDFCVKVPIINIYFDADLRLGDVKEYDCTLGYNYNKSEVIASWDEYASNKVFANPLILTVDQSINNTVYICNLLIIKNPFNCPFQQGNVSVTVKDTFIMRLMINTVHLNLSNTFQHLDCHITTNTDINTTNTDINSIVNVSWYRDNGNENRLVSDSEGVSILPIVSVTYTSFNSTLRFSPITSSTPVSTLGNYTCVAWIGGQSVRIKTSNNVQVTMKINNSRDVVSMSLLNEYTAGDSFNATCMITAHQLSPPIASKATINIIHNSSIIRSGVADIGTTGSHKRSLNIPFTNLKLSRSGEYMCHYIRSNNSFVQPSDVKSTATELNIRIPIDSTSLVLKPTESYYEAGNNITLSCKVTKPNSPLVDTVVNMKWSSNTNISQQYSIHPYSSYFNHILTNIKLSEAGEYSCTYYLNSTTNNPYIVPSDVRTGVTNVIIRIPNGNNPSITPLSSYYNVGNSISLICSVTYPHSPLIDIATNVNIQWLNSSNHTLHSYTGINNNTEHTISYTINNVSLSDAGEYTCQYNVSSTDSSFVLSSGYMTASTNVSIQIPNNKVPVITLIPHQSVYDAGSDITLSCSVTYPYSSFIDVDTNLTLQWFNSSNHTLNSSTIINDNNGHTLTYTISNARLSDAGLYTCSFFINSVPHIVTSDTTMNSIIISIKIPSAVNPSITQLNSYYTVGDSISLICSVTYPHSPLIDIATNVNIQWLDSSNHTLHSYTGINNNTEHTISYTINNVSLSDAGQYTCQYNISSTNHSFVLPSDNIRASVNVTVNAPNGVSPLITQFKPYYSVGDSISLICSVIYPDSPLIDIATNVNIQWLFSSNHTLHSYTGINNNTEHTISYTINNVSLSDAGQYTCQYNISSTNHSFVLPSDNMRTSTNVSVKIPNDKVPVINLIPHQSVYDAGSDITLSCSVTYPYSSYIDFNTNLTLQWFNSSNHTLNSSTITNDYNGHTLTYTISNARLSDAGQYTCSFFINTKSTPYIVTSNSTANFITINITIPNVITPYILVHPSKSYYNVNDNITLSCTIHYPTNHLIDVNATVNIQWLNYNYSLDSYRYELNDHSEYSFNYTISSLKLPDAGQYTCSFFINATMSTSITRSRTNYNFTSIIVKIPNGEGPSVTQLKPYYRVGDNINLICSATYPSHITTNVNIQWLNSSNHILHSYTGINNNTEHTISYTINNVSLSDAGQYTCQYSISSTNHSFVLPSDNMRTSVNVTVNGTVKPPKLIVISSFSLILSWSPPTTHQSIPIIGYNYTCIGIN
uniref:Ig-like domain-containing protein n=1 Tax=Amphimedon queenslandica TaxID=400682 RepID=A0A1X7THZ3_AMPQE